MLDYDLVIIGGTAAGRYAALTATNFPARVALVEPLSNSQDLPAGGKESIALGLKYSQTLREAARFAHQMSHPQFGLRPDLANSEMPIALQFNGVKKWADGVVSNLSEIDDLAVLAARGVDIIFGNSEFVAKPDLALIAGDRKLRSRCYLLACPTLPAIPNIEGLSSVGFFTSETVGELAKLPELPKSLAVIGADPSGVEVAQTFSRLGVAVTLVVKSSQILAKEDREAAGLVQAGMEAEGVRILTATEVTQARVIDGKKWIQAGPRAIEAEEIFLAAGRGHNFAWLNLEAARVKFSDRGLILNEKLQTTNSRIYACGDVAGGYSFPHIANCEAAVAVKNALFLPMYQIDYRGIPWAIFSDPQLARVGLTEAQARRRFGDDLIVAREYFKNVERAQMSGETTGFCKIVGRRDGEILGATIVGPQAAELIHAIAFAVRHGMKVEAIAELPYIWSSFSAINGQTAAVWESQRLRSNTFMQNLWENLFHWRRYWNR
ncbi:MULTISPECIES: NAD(P)/FAD-dependent oxidoreductase [unclassified Microcoleus]|uniref:dihydrolipoyl dehydrogenase family protein n=1 Tax=unclassified Microcoleus TaxID=2642155 RepID=UPI001D8357CD|nr:MULTISPECIES: NAD(P)/FAD-dependent oxidoreductase [unclassified Microcoleus]MCC3564248.1 NAD(P)/FAD-dependent oxidoreductase [Microcoleus sp. PH2017_31_RDM_U_A]MCC3576587.1 NAD(P)/FAD-dependent oxidoreductase [Microcoleus sp. PH2017_32_RDM_D_A]MCC3614479.1 NAD(P)/FAD-dependent oxidoreductase [Microcoleus sp. PH2017_38_RDM_U_B]